SAAASLRTSSFEGSDGSWRAENSIDGLGYDLSRLIGERSRRHELACTPEPNAEQRQLLALSGSQNCPLRPLMGTKRIWVRASSASATVYWPRKPLVGDENAPPRQTPVAHH